MPPLHVMRLAAVHCLAGSLCLLSLPALAFGTINSLGQSAEHEKITRLALRREGFEPHTLDELAGKTGTFGAVGAPDRPDRGLMSQKQVHCDGGDHLDLPDYPQTAADARRWLAACRQWIFASLDAAVNAAGRLLDGNGQVRDSQIPTRVPCGYNGRSGRAKCDVLEALGLALHAAQDFYSHSNWTDADPPGRASLSEPPGLGNRAPARWLDPRRTYRFPAGLISGCYDGFPEALHCEGRVRHESLNKDTGAIDAASGRIGRGSTPRGEVGGNFARAVGAAILDTRDKWAAFRERVLRIHGPERGGRIICAVLRDDPARSCN